MAVNLWVEVARFGCALWGLAILPVVVAFLFEHRIQQWWVRRLWRGHVVVCGSCSRTRALVADLRAGGRHVAWIGTCDGAEAPALPGIFHLDGDSGDPAVLRKCRVDRAQQLVALHDSDLLNVETLVAAGKACAARHQPLDAFAHIADPGLRRTLEKVSGQDVGFAGDRVHATLFNYYGHFSRLLARRFPLPPAMTDEPPVPEHLILVGFAAFGQSVLLRTLLMSQQLYRVQTPTGPTWRVAKPRVTIVDPMAERLLAEFMQSYPAIRQYCELRSESVHSTDVRFLHLPCFTQRMERERKTLLLCIEEEAEILRIAGLMADASRRQADAGVDRVFVRLGRPDRLLPLLKRAFPDGNRPDVQVFATDADVFTADVILNRRLDLLARECHAAYRTVEEADRRANNLPTAAGKTWEELSEDDRDQNREAADHLWAKLRMLGYALTEAKGDAEPPPTALIEELRRREEEFALAEHCRWMTKRILDDWSWGANRDDKLRRHPDICDYEKLRDTTKDKDRVNIRVIPRLLELGQLRVERPAEDAHR